MANSKAIGVAYSDPALDGGTIDNTPIGGTTAAAGAFTTLNASGATTLDGTVALGNASSDTIGFYGATKVSRRAYSSAVHATSGQSVSASFGAIQLATLQELMNTNIALGIWATA